MQKVTYQKPFLSYPEQTALLKSRGMVFGSEEKALHLLNTVNPKHTFRQKLESLFAKYPNVDRAAMGFPADWRSELLWKMES